MRPFSGSIELADDLELTSFKEAFSQNLNQLKKLSSRKLTFGPVQISIEDYILAIEHLLNLLISDPSGSAFKAALKKDFQVLEVYGGEKWGEVLVTSYFEPVLNGSLKKTEQYHQALYKKPEDLVKVDLKSFTENMPGLKFPQDLFENKTLPSVLKGRLLSSEKPARIVPYYDRSQIDSGNALQNKKLELAWADPIDVFFLQIQGSGIIQFHGGKKIHVGYAEQNGHSYSPIGKFLLDTIPKEKITMQSIEKHLRSLPLAQARKILEMNRSYVFFQELKGSAQTSFGVDATAGRTIAADQNYFPKGTLAFIQYERPEFTSPTDDEPARWIPSSRFVLDQDIGGAIRGTDHIDLFWGRGDIAKQTAGVMKNKGRLYYFAPRAEFIASLKN